MISVSLKKGSEEKQIIFESKLQDQNNLNEVLQNLSQAKQLTEQFFKDIEQNQAEEKIIKKVKLNEQDHENEEYNEEEQIDDDEIQQDNQQ